jgi:hypothetical protein
MPTTSLGHPLRAAGLALAVLAAASAVSAQSLTPDLGSLATIRPGVKSKRISSYDRTGGNNDRLTGIAPGEKRVLADIPGAGIINHIWITIAPPPPRLKRNDIVLRMYWDGRKEPSVASPIGPFFGQGWNESYNYVSLPLSANPKEGRALVSYFPMPFAAGARIEIENQSPTDPIDAFYYYVDYVEVASLPAGLGRFHAWYNYQITEAPEAGENEWRVIRPFDNNPRGERNYVIADIAGKGHFVGVNYFVNSPSPIWYGEGDDMIFIDGSPLPTLHGTGTEDYFNTSWCPKELLSHPYFGYARINNESGWLGRTHVYRFHINDPIYFDQALRFTIEHGHANGLTLELASVAYWYQDQAAAVKPIVARDARQPKEIVSPRDIFRWRDEWRKARGNAPTLWGNEK